MTLFLLYYCLTFQPQTFILLIALKKTIGGKIEKCSNTKLKLSPETFYKYEEAVNHARLRTRTYVYKFSIFFNSAYNHPTIQTVQEGIHPEHLPESALRLRQSETWNSFDLYRTICSQSLSHVAQEWHFCTRRHTCRYRHPFEYRYQRGHDRALFSAKHAEAGLDHWRWFSCEL